MRRAEHLVLHACTLALLLSFSATVRAEPATDTAAPVTSSAITASAMETALREAIAQLPAATSDGERADREALNAFYQSRTALLWLDDAGLKSSATSLIAEMNNASDYGLDAKLLEVPDSANSAASDPLLRAKFDVALTRSAMTYARHARGGRIASPAEMLNSNLDRKPQIIAPDVVLRTLSEAAEPDAALRGFHPKHPQFEKLRQAYLKERGEGSRPLNPSAKKLRANMEMWRWMWDDLGALYVFNNIPEFMQYVYKDGQLIRSERIVAGMIDKQSSIFSRPLKYVVLRPQWRVPESIMVHELWPSLLRGGGLMRQHGLEIETKTGEARDWRRIDWSRDDIRNYIVLQPPGPNSALGYVKFSFPSQHTIFMHDTPDKWMFRSAQRTLSHGCLRVRNPMQLAEIILKEDKGWDAAKVAEISKSGPLNNEIAMDKNIPIHLAYFTAWVGDDGRVKAFRDIYGHEKRVTQALDGAWDKISKGRNHLAAPEPRFDPAKVARGGPAATSKKRAEPSVGEMLSSAMGMTF